MTTTGPGLVRDAVPDDAVRCAEIYAPYVRDTAISFETEPPTAADMARRIADAQRDHAWLVLEDGGEVTRLRVQRALHEPGRLPVVGHRERLSRRRSSPIRRRACPVQGVVRPPRRPRDPDGAGRRGAAQRGK